MTKYNHEYVVTSERHFWDETEVTIYTNREMEVGDTYESDGLIWYVEAKIR